MVLPGIANRLAAAFGNYAPLHEEQRQQQLKMQQDTAASENAVRGSQLQTNALTRQHLQQTIDNTRTPEQEADLQLGTQKKLHALKPPESEIDTDSSGNLIRNEFNSDTQKWSPRTHEVPNPALDQYNNPSAPKPNYVQDWNAPPPSSIPKTIPEAVHPLPPAPMLGVAYGPTVQDPSGQFVQDQRSKLTGKSVGSIPVGGTPVAAMPTTSYSSTNKVEKDVNNNLVNVPETSVNTRVRGGAGAAPPSPFPSPRSGAATPIMGADGAQLHAPLSADGKKTLRQVSTSGQMLNSIMPDLQQAVTDIGHGSNIYDATQTRASWMEYSKGLDPNNIDPNSPVAALPGADPRITKMFPAIAMMKVVLAQPFMNNSRNFQFMQQIQQHVPDPEKDTPQLMLSKAQWIQKSLPMIKQAVMESEGVSQPPAGPPTPPVPGAIDPKNPLGL